MFKKSILINFVLITILLFVVFFSVKDRVVLKEKTIDAVDFFDENSGSDNIRIKYFKEEDYLLIAAKRGYEHRVINSIYMFVNAFNLVRDEIKDDFQVKIETKDFSENSSNFAYSHRDGSSLLSPDFLFVNWPEVGIDNYDDMCKEIEEAGKIPYIYNQIFWIGHPGTNKARRKMVKKSFENKNFLFIPMNWNKKGKELKNAGRLNRLNASIYVSLPDHTKFKYLIDVAGEGYSARGKLLLFSNRPLFYVDRKDKEFYMQDLKPFVHYIPVREDLTDLEEKFLWAENHYDEAQQIAKNALDYAKQNLTQKAVLVWYAKRILDYANKTK